MEAVRIAEFILTEYLKMNKPITNLKLQKLLYFVQGATLAIFGRAAFSDTIEAWQYGPVVPSVYDVYSLYGSLNIRREYTENLESDDDIRSVTIFVCHHYRDWGAFNLVTETHKQGSPWSEFYKVGAKNIIKTQAIQSYFSEHYLKEWFGENVQS